MTKQTSNEKENNDIDSVVRLPLSENMLSDLQAQDNVLFSYPNTNRKR